MDGPLQWGFYVFFHFILGHKHGTLSGVLLGRKNSKLCQTPKFYPQMYILQTRRQFSQGFHFSIAHWKGHVLQTKVYKNIIPLLFCFSKFIEVYKLLKSGGLPRFSVNKNTDIKCICYINNMFSKFFINQAFKSYSFFDFIYTYSRYRFKIIKLWWYLLPENYQSHLKPLKRSYFNIEES